MNKTISILLFSFLLVSHANAEDKAALQTQLKTRLSKIVQMMAAPDLSKLTTFKNLEGWNQGRIGDLIDLAQKSKTNVKLKTKSLKAKDKLKTGDWATATDLFSKLLGPEAKGTDALNDLDEDELTEINSLLATMETTLNNARTAAIEKAGAPTDRSDSILKNGKAKTGGSTESSQGKGAGKGAGERKHGGPSPQGGSPGGRGYGEQPSDAAKEWDKIARKAKLPPAVDAKIFDNFLKKLNSKDQSERIQSARWFVKRIPSQFLKDARTKAKQFGLNKDAEQTLRQYETANLEKDTEKLRKELENRTPNRLETEVARDELLRRYEEDPLYKQAISDLFANRPGRAAYFAARMGGADEKQAAKTMAEILGGMNDDELMRLATKMNRPKTENVPLSRYNARMRVAIQEALQARGVNVRDITKEDLTAAGFTDAEADAAIGAFKQKFIEEFTRKLQENVEFVTENEKAARGTEAERLARRAKLLEESNVEDLMDHLGHLTEMAQKTPPGAAKNALQRQAENLYMILGRKLPDGTWVLDGVAKDAGFKHGDKVRTFAVGKGGQVFAGLKTLNDRQHGPEKESIGPIAKRNRLQSFVPHFNTDAHRKWGTKVYYARKDGKGTRGVGILPQSNDPSRPLLLPRSSDLATGTPSTPPRPPTGGKKRLPTKLNFPDDFDLTLMRNVFQRCAACHGTKGGFKLVPSDFSKATKAELIAARQQVLNKLGKRLSGNALIEGLDNLLFHKKGNMVGRVKSKLPLSEAQQQAIREFFGLTSNQATPTGSGKGSGSSGGSTGSSSGGAKGSGGSTGGTKSGSLPPILSGKLTKLGKRFTIPNPTIPGKQVEVDSGKFGPQLQKLAASGTPVRLRGHVEKRGNDDIFVVDGIEPAGGTGKGDLIPPVRGNGGKDKSPGTRFAGKRGSVSIKL